MQTNHHHQHHGQAGDRELEHGHDCCARAQTAALKDPVCGMSVTPASPHHFDFEGETFYFCGGGCRAKFAADPQGYLQKASKPAAPIPEAAEGTVYTCPMHPEIRQDGPGNCPKCGMALEPLMPSLDEGENPELVIVPAPLLVDAAVHDRRRGAGDVRSPAGLVRHDRAELDRARAVAAGRAVGRQAVLRARRASRSSTAARTCGR